MVSPKNNASPAAARLCSIYARDILRFLPRREVGTLHLASSAMAIVVGANKSRLPKHIFLELEITAVGNQLCQPSLTQLYHKYSHSSSTPLQDWAWCGAARIADSETSPAPSSPTAAALKTFSIRWPRGWSTNPSSSTVPRPRR
jgi:hypothetical protein